MHPGELLTGSLFTAIHELPLGLDAWLCDLRSRFLAKERVGRSYRAIARNGRVLLTTDLPLADLADRPARLRFQVWHRAILLGDRAEPYGVLLCVRSNVPPPHDSFYTSRLVKLPSPSCPLAVEVGGGLVLEFERR